MDVYNSLSRFNDHDLPENFVSIAVSISPDTLIPFHAAILIRYKSVNYLHHFPGSQAPLVVDGFDETGWHIYKILDAFNYNDESEIGSILQYCRRVCNQSDITYSYIVDGSEYADKGNFVSEEGLPELGTCVGFCLNTLKGALIDIETSILCLEDWDDREVIERVDNWSKHQVMQKYPDLDWDLYNAFKKRITPLEYLCTAYFDQYPIRKDAIDNKKDDLFKEIQLIYGVN